MTPGFPPVLGIDEDWSKANPAALYDSGYRFAIGYVSEDTAGKNITRDQVDALHAAGLDVGLVYEYSASAALGGAARGARDAGIAIAQARLLGAPAGTAIYAAIDFNVSATQMTAAAGYALAFQSACRAAGYRAGVYGGYPMCRALGTAGYTGFLWQTYAWSAGQWWPGAVIQQQQNGIHVAGATVDRDEAEAQDWGQWTAGGTMDFGPSDVNAWHLAARVDAIRTGSDTDAYGEDMTGLYKRIAREVVATLPAPPESTPVTLTDADLEDIATLVVRQIKAQLVQLISPTP